MSTPALARQLHCASIQRVGNQRPTACQMRTGVSMDRIRSVTFAAIGNADHQVTPASTTWRASVTEPMLVTATEPLERDCGLSDGSCRDVGHGCCQIERT